MHNNFVQCTKMSEKSSKRRNDLGSCVLDKQHMKDALTSLKICLPKAKNLMRKKCGKEDVHFCRGSAVVTPFSHTYVLLELRKCLLRHNWIAATKLLLMLLDGGSLFLKKVMLKSCMCILLNHPRSSLQHRQEFIRMCSGVVHADELLKSLLTFPSDKKQKHFVSYCAPL